MSNSSGTKFHSIGRWAVNTEAAICNAYTRGGDVAWREGRVGRVGSWTQGVGVGGRMLPDPASAL